MGFNIACNYTRMAREYLELACTQEGRVAKPKVFLSYARADDETFAKRLRDDLVARNVDVWWDRTSMTNRGRTFLQELRDAIEGADRLIAIIEVWK